MLGGIDPIIIFHRYKKTTVETDIANQCECAPKSIPVIAKKDIYIPLPPIPIYLSENLTGMFIDSESKNIDIETETQTFSDGSTADVNQKGIASGVSIQITAKKDSLGMILLASLMDTLMDKVTSKEYAITYLHGATTIFFGLLHTFSVEQTSQNELLSIKVEMSRGSKQPVKPTVVAPVPGLTGALPGG